MTVTACCGPLTEGGVYVFGEFVGSWRLHVNADIKLTTPLAMCELVTLCELKRFHGKFQRLYEYQHHRHCVKLVRQDC